ncbi:MAG: helix-turn-helix domain-containing protein [Acidobacteriota bacterium]
MILDYADVERSLIVQAMRKAGGVKKKAAELLGLTSAPHSWKS